MHALLKRQLKRHGPVLPDEDLPPLWAGLLEAVSNAYQQFDEDRQMLERSLELTSSELIDKNALIEEQKEELQRSNTELENFAYIASHDLQEPLRTVQSYVQLLRKRYASKLDSDANEFMDFAVEGVTRMRALIDDLLTYARLSSRARPFERVSLDGVLDEVGRSLKVRLDEKRAVIDRSPLPEVMADKRQIAQLLQNLIANAVKFHKPGAHPTVKVSAERRDVEFVITVADDGIGIGPEYCVARSTSGSRLASSKQENCTTRTAEVIRNSTRESDIVGRFGGEEFIAILPDTDLEGAMIVAEKIRANVERQCSTTVSIGVSVLEPIDGEALRKDPVLEESLRMIIHRADTAMYASKRNGRNRVTAWTDAL